MLRSDFLGITSVIRDAMPDGNCYESMLHFFYSSAWSLDALRLKWYSVVSNSGFALKRCDRYVLAGDGVKALKEAQFMPGVKKAVRWILLSFLDNKSGTEYPKLP